MQKSLTKRSVIKRGRSINSCLLTLGAERSEVYTTKKDGNPQSLWGFKAGLSIYNQYTKDELLTWATSLYQKAVIQFHPDKGGDLKSMQEINAAFDQVKKILSN